MFSCSNTKMLPLSYSKKLNHLVDRISYICRFQKSKCETLIRYSTAAEKTCSRVHKPLNIPYGHAKIGNFFQEKPKLNNTFLTDLPLQRFLNHTVPQEVNREISKDLTLFGERIVNEIDDLGRQCELHLPSLKSQDAWGKRIDELETCSAWKKQHDISAEEGLVAIGYERKLQEWSRLHQICKLYLYAPSAGMYSCPLAMTDGAAKTIEVIASEKPIFKKAFRNLTSRSPSKFWTSGQWMTERKGGSDVASGTETVAVPENDFYRLYGYKWFTSATDSNMALTLARELEHPDEPWDNKGLTLFYVETKNEEGNLNNIQLMRLKDKLGTRQVPTAELLLDGTAAHKMSEKGAGISTIANMLNITRLYNAVGAVGSMRRILQLARDYSQRRVAFGRKLSEYPLHMQTLSKMEVEVRGSLLLVLKAAVLLGKTELKCATDDEILLLRLMLPLLKLYTAKQAVSVISEGLEAFGGQGYIEDTGLPVMLRDAQVLPIWEGTTNIMALDVLRSFSKSGFQTLKSFERSVHSCLELARKNRDWQNSSSRVENSLSHIINFAEKFTELLPIAARDLSYSLARTYIGALLIENACITRNTSDIIAAQRWCDFQDLCPLLHNHQKSSYEEVHKDMQLVMEEQ